MLTTTRAASALVDQRGHVIPPRTEASVASNYELWHAGPIAVGSLDVSGLIDRPEPLCEEAIVKIELAANDRPLFRVDVRDAVQRHRQRAVAAVLRHITPRRGDEKGAVLGRCEPVGGSLVGGRKLSLAAHRLADSEVGHWIVSFDRQAVLRVRRR